MGAKPSPAPTLDPHFPGFYPATPAHEDLPTIGTSSPFADDPVHAREALEPLTSQPSTFEQAEHALLGAAAGLVAKVGHLAGVPASQVDGIDELTRNLEPSTRAGEHSGDSTGTLKAAGTPVDETHRPEFGLDAVNKAHAHLAASPAQRLVSGGAGGDDDGGARALGGALLAGAAGAKVEENEVREPGTADNERERMGLVEPQEPTPATPAAPDFGTPAIEKEQAALAASPAQQLLRADSSLHADQVTLLAGAAGAKLGGSREVEEPAQAPLNVATDRALEAGAGLPSPSSEATHSVPLEREVSSPLASVDSTSAGESADRPSLSIPHASTSSFTADVLAAGENIETPVEAPGPAAAGFGFRSPGEIVANDHDLRGVCTPHASRPTSGSVTPPATAAKEDDVVHNPSPLIAAAAAGSIAGAALGQKDAPKDFEPYTPPIVEPTQAATELQQAASVPVPETPTSETPTDSHRTTDTFTPAALGAAAVPLAPTHSYDQNAPTTVNAQNVRGASDEGVTSPMNENIEMETALEEGPAEVEGQKKDKGKGKEVLGAAAIGTAGVGAGVGMKQLLDGERNNSHAAHSKASNFDTATSAAPLTTDSTLDSAQHDPFLTKPDPLSEQRAFPTVPHMRATHEAIHDPAVGGSEAANRGRVLDPHELAASNAPTSPEQAGFTNVTEITPAMQDFAHLSAPAPQATEQALAETPVDPIVAEEDEHKHSNAPLAVGAGIAGIGAGAAGAGIISREREHTQPAAAISHGAPAALSPAAAPGAAEYAAPASVPQAAEPAPVTQAAAHPAVAHAATAPQTAAQPVLTAATTAPAAAAPVEKRTPISRFTEETFYPHATGNETPSSTRAVMGSPPSSVRDRSAATTPVATTPVQSTTPTQSLFEAGILEKSPHMRIQTHKVDGHKRLHRKSLSGVVAPAGSLSRRSGDSPRHSPRQSIDVDRSASVPSTAAMSGPTGAVGERIPPANQEGRRDRMLDSMVGVHDPTVGGYDSPHGQATSAASSPRSLTGNVGVAQTYPGAPPTSNVTATYAPGTAGPVPHGSAVPSPAAAQVPAQAYHAQQVPASHGSGSVHRKLSKKHASTAGTPEKSGGFFSRVFGGGSK